MFKYLGFCLITWLISFVCNNVAFLILFMRTIRGHKEPSSQQGSWAVHRLQVDFLPLSSILSFLFYPFQIHFPSLVWGFPNNLICSSDLCSKLQTQSHVSHCHMRFSTSAFPLVFLSRKWLCHRPNGPNWIPFPHKKQPLFFVRSVSLMPLFVDLMVEMGTFMLHLFYNFKRLTMLYAKNH